MSDKNFRPNIEFRRRIGGIVYCFHPCAPINGKIAWKREDFDLWITKVDGLGWACIDKNNRICGIPWSNALNKSHEIPPAGEWISKKDDKSYVYDVTYIDRNRKIQKDNKDYQSSDPESSNLPAFKNVLKQEGLILETKNLVVFRPSLSDFENLYSLLSDSDVTRYVGNGSKTLEEVRDQLDKFIKHYEKHGFSLAPVFEKSTGEYVGRAGLIYLAMDDTQEDIELGYALHKRFWNKGYATELAKAFVNWGFEHLSNNYFVAVIRPENEPSRKVLEKIGMRYVGRESYLDKEVAKYIIYKKETDLNDVTLVPATTADYPTIQNMARFYGYDISEHYGHEPGWEMDETGLYGAGVDFKQYLDIPNTFPFLVRYKGELAGFAIVDKKGSDSSIDFNMAQFFILRTYKFKGIGKYVAKKCFDKFRGSWEIMVMPENENAYRFWRNVIKEYTNNNFNEYTKKVAHFNNEKRNFFKFMSKR